jgi:hypothetical protein
MSVTVVPSAAAGESGLRVQSEVTAAALAATRATAFLRAQTLWLQRGLSRCDDRFAVDLVLDAHDRSHDRWLGVIAQVSRHLGEEAAGQVAAVYAHLGRVAGSLERDAMALLSPEVASQARTLVADRMEDLTEQTVESLWAWAAQA